MLKLILSHWQTNREPLPFVLTDDPLYCSHLTKSPFPEVYSVNRVNPLFEDDENDQAKRDDSSPSIHHLKRSLSEERRENETRASDDTGYCSSGHLKSVTTADSLSDDVASQHMSSDSDDYSQPEAIVVSADVHRVSYPEDVIVPSPANSSNCSQIFSANSLSSHYEVNSDSSQDLFDSLTMSSSNDKPVVTEVKKPNLAVREKLQKLLEKGNERASETYLDSLEAKPSTEREIERTKTDLMKSLTRALSTKVPNRDATVPKESVETVTRTDSALDVIKQTQQSLDRKSISSSTSPKSLFFSTSSRQKETSGVTRQDESSASSSISFTKQKRHRNTKHPAEKESKRVSSEKTVEDTSDSKKSTTTNCKLCENAHRPLAFHQLLPGHWSYDNVYLPHQNTGMCCSCMHHNHANNSYPLSSDDEVFYPFYYPHDVARARHSWAPYTNSQGMFDNPPKRKRTLETKTVSSSSKENSGSSRYSPDGSSRETDSSQTDSSHLKKPLSQRRSLREPKKCKCEHCLERVLDKDKKRSHHLDSHTCPCHCLSNRRVKFASDTDVSQHRHMHSIPVRLGKDGGKLVNGDPINAAFVMNLPHLNGHALSSKSGTKENGVKSKSAPPLIPRGLKEPIKMDELYRTYPINFKEWEAHYRRNFLQKRRKRALNMVGMAIGIILVVGIAVALTFVFLRIRRPV